MITSSSRDMTDKAVATMGVIWDLSHLKKSSLNCAALVQEVPRDIVDACSSVQHSGMDAFLGWTYSGATKQQSWYVSLTSTPTESRLRGSSTLLFRRPIACSSTAAAAISRMMVSSITMEYTSRMQRPHR